jgi:hypothetical protein
MYDTYENITESHTIKIVVKNNKENKLKTKKSWLLHLYRLLVSSGAARRHLNTYQYK